MRNKSLINLIVGVVMFGIGLFMVYHITSSIDFNSTTVIVNDSPNLWQFLAFIPILVTMFIGALSFVNGILASNVMSIIEIVLNIALVVFIKYDLYGFASVVPVYNNIIGYLVIALIVVSVFILFDILISIVKKTKVKNRKLNLEME